MRRCNRFAKASALALDKFAAEYVSNRAIGEDGYLAKKGLVTLPKKELEEVRKGISGMTAMQAPNS